MDEEKFFDYAKGVKAPYWIQEIRTPKGKLIWYFSTPVQLSFFVVFALVLVLMFLTLSDVISFLSKYTHSIPMLLYFFVPHRLAKFYVEYEPQGKKMHEYIWDYLVYLVEFVFDNRSISQGERVEEIEEIVFEKTHL